MTARLIPAGWHPDPSRRYDYRYWDGAGWTYHVASGGRQLVDTLFSAQSVSVATNAAVATSAAPVPANPTVLRQVRRMGLTNDPGGRDDTLFTAQLLVVNQKPKLMERRAEYGVFDRHGRKLGAVKQFGRSFSTAAMGRDHETRRLRIVDSDGLTLLTLTRPAMLMRSRVVVRRDDGTSVGEIVQDNLGLLAGVVGGRFNIRFRLESHGRVIGWIHAENWRDWDFSVQDANEDEVARITKVRAGLVAEMFTTADSYVVEIHRPLADPMRSLVVSAALAMDTVLHQGRT